MIPRIDIDRNQLKDLYVAVDGIEKNLPRHLRAAINQTVKRIRVKVAAKIGQFMNIKNNFEPPTIKKADTLKRTISGKRMASNTSASATLSFWGGHAFPLKYFDAKPIVRKRKGKAIYKGVQYKVDRPGKIKRLSGQVDAQNPEAYFMLPNKRNNIFKRVGKTAKPIVLLSGPSPADYYQKAQAVPMAVQIAQERLPIEIKRRIRAILLEKKGIIKLKASRGT